MWVPTEGVDVVIEADAVVLLFRSRSWGGKFGQIIRPRVPITWTLFALGGRRPWFRCDADYVASTATAVLRFCTAVAGLSPAATAAVSNMRARMKPRPSAQLAGSERSECASVLASASPSHFLKSLRECIGAPTCVCEPLPASEDPLIRDGRRGAGSVHDGPAWRHDHLFLTGSGRQRILSEAPLPWSAPCLRTSLRRLILHHKLSALRAS
jgi:hypothetical protein